MSSELIRSLEDEIADQRAARADLAEQLGVMEAKRDHYRDRVEELEAELARYKAEVEGPRDPAVYHADPAYDATTEWASFVPAVEAGIHKRIQLAPGDRITITCQEPKL